MEVKQIANILNTIAAEKLGESVIVAEDLSDIVDAGDTFVNRIGLDNYVRALNDVVGRMVFVDRVYRGRAPSVVMDGWEYGSIMEKISVDLPDAEENDSWQLSDGASYDPNIFRAPSVTVKVYNQRVTYQIPMSFTEKQVKSAFNSASQMNAFISMIYTAINNSMTIKTDGLVERAINNMIGETMYAEFPGGTYTGDSKIKAVNLLYLYNQIAANPITVDDCLVDADFIRFASKTMKDYVDRMGVMSTLFNIDGKARFTPADRLHVVLLSEFANAADVYLQSDTFHDEMVALPAHEDVPYWQGSGTDYAFTSTGKVNIKTASNNSVEVTGVLGVMFDRDALGVANVDPRVTSLYNPAAEFWNEWHKWDAMLFNDTAENFVVFYVAAA